jgi:hypothetical protein
MFSVDSESRGWIQQSEQQSMRAQANHTAPVDSVRAVAQNLPSSDGAALAVDEKFGQLSTLQKLLLARQLGYDSFDSMLAASTVVSLSDGSTWWLTADRFGGRTAWNLCQLDFPQIT